MLMISCIFISPVTRPSYWTPINSSEPLGRELPVETRDFHSLRHKCLSCFAWNKNSYSSDSGDGVYITTDCDTRMEQLCIITSLLDNWCRRLADKERKLTLLSSLGRCWSHLYSLRRIWYRWLVCLFSTFCPVGKLALQMLCSCDFHLEIPKV